MEDKYYFGTKLRNFRKNAGLSQLQLETQAGMAQGALSRIENGEVTPLKQTLEKISEILLLTDRERRYLYGDLAYPATEEQINKARAAVAEHFNTKGTLAYLVDDRFKFIDISKSFLKVLNISDEMYEAVKNKSFYEAILSDKYNFKKDLDPDYAEEIIKNMVNRFYSEAYFMLEDEDIQDSINAIKEHPIANKYYQIALREKPRNYYGNETKRVVFRLLGLPLKFTYSDATLIDMVRFYVVDYMPENNLYKKVFKVLL
jgi:transcriptional regulator with XRE-family HTH domain